MGDESWLQCRTAKAGKIVLVNVVKITSLNLYCPYMQSNLGITTSICRGYKLGCGGLLMRLKERGVRSWRQAGHSDGVVVLGRQVVALWCNGATLDIEGRLLKTTTGRY